ncbi:hypothetical protein CHUAL_010042 [Chamberlinius hualienensis]
MTTIKAPKLKLYNGLEMPQIGLGTWKSQPQVVKEAVKAAVYAGYRHIDCAYMYLNEDEVGQAIHELFSEGVVKREELFITTKLWNTFHSTARVKEAIKLSLKALGLAYVDLYLMHWPIAYKEGKENLPKDENGLFIMADIDYIETWKGLEDLVREGHCRSIGVSNFNAEQIQRVLDEGDIQPAVLQVECHPYLNQQKLIDFCNSKNIVVTAYSPLGSPDRMWAKSDDPKVMEDPIIKAIAEKHGKSPAQIAIKFQVQRHIVVIPKSANPERIKENINIFDFELSKDEMKALTDLNRNYRAILVPWMSHSSYYPFKDELPA